MNIYKKVKKGRKKQVSYIYDEIVASQYPTEDDDDMLINELLILIDNNWKRAFPIVDSQDAYKVAKRIMKRILCLDVDRSIYIDDFISVYLNLFYLEDYINGSLIQNSKLINTYSYIRSYMDNYESQAGFIQIKY